VEHISTGDLFRAEVAAGTELGRQVAGYLDRGDLVPDDLAGSIVRERVEAAVRTSGGYLLDGYPRTLAQAHAAHALAVELGIQAGVAVTFDVSRAVLLERLLGRGDEAGRTDDDAATIRHRLEVYDAETEPVLDYYDELGVLVRIPAEGTVEQVTAVTLATLRAMLDADGAREDEAVATDDPESLFDAPPGGGADETAGSSDGPERSTSAPEGSTVPPAVSGPGAPARRSPAKKAAAPTPRPAKKAAAPRKATAKAQGGAATAAGGDGPAQAPAEGPAPAPSRAPSRRAVRRDVGDDAAPARPARPGTAVVLAGSVRPVNAEPPPVGLLVAWPERAMVATVALTATVVLLLLGVVAIGLAAPAKEGPLGARLGAAFVGQVGTADALLLFVAAATAAWAGSTGASRRGLLGVDTLRRVLLVVAVAMFVALPFAAWGQVSYLRHTHQAVDQVIRRQLATYLAVTMIPCGLAGLFAWWA